MSTCSQDARTWRVSVGELAEHIADFCSLPQSPFAAVCSDLDAARAIIAAQDAALAKAEADLAAARVEAAAEMREACAADLDEVAAHWRQKRNNAESRGPSYRESICDAKVAILEVAARNIRALPLTPPATTEHPHADQG